MFTKSVTTRCRRATQAGGGGLESSATTGRSPLSLTHGMHDRIASVWYQRRLLILPVTKPSSCSMGGVEWGR
jgi:hypothetical protein